MPEAEEQMRLEKLKILKTVKIANLLHHHCSHCLCFSFLLSCICWRRTHMETLKAAAEIENTPLLKSVEKYKL